MARRENYSIKFGQQQLLIEDAPDSGFFGAPCGITGLTRTVDTNTTDINLPPCEDPDAVTWLGIDEVSKRMTLAFQGTLAFMALPIWDDWAVKTGGLRLVRWYRNLDQPELRGYWEGEALLTQYQEESADRARYTNSGTIIFDGQPQWVGMPPAPVITSKVSIPTTAPKVATVFTGVTGAYVSTPAVTKSYQWKADGMDIPGATSIGYTPVTGDIGKRLTLIERALNPSGSVLTTSARSLAVIP